MGKLRGAPWLLTMVSLACIVAIRVALINHDLIEGEYAALLALLAFAAPALLQGVGLVLYLAQRRWNDAALNALTLPPLWFFAFLALGPDVFFHGGE